MGVVIIGHGESPKGLGLGLEIDQHIVVRLKDPSWQDPKDYGKRTDYMCASTETMQVMLDFKKVPIEYWAQPKRGSWSAITEQRFREQAKAPLTIQIEIHKKWNAKFLELCDDATIPNHSLGMAAITYAAVLLEPEDIYLLGFDNLLDPNRLDYYKANKGRWVTRHCWHTENRMLPLIEKEYGVVIKAFA